MVLLFQLISTNLNYFSHSLRTSNTAWKKFYCPCAIYCEKCIPLHLKNVVRDAGRIGAVLFENASPEIVIINKGHEKKSSVELLESEALFKK